MQSNNNASWRGITLKYQLLRIYSLKRLKGAWLYSSREQAAPLTEVIHLSRLEKTSVPVRQNSPLPKPRAGTDSPRARTGGHQACSQWAPSCLQPLHPGDTLLGSGIGRGTAGPGPAEPPVRSGGENTACSPINNCNQLFIWIHFYKEGRIIINIALTRREGRLFYCLL